MGNTVCYFLLTNGTVIKKYQDSSVHKFSNASAHFEHIGFLSFLPKLLIVLVKVRHHLELHSNYTSCSVFMVLVA